MKKKTFALALCVLLMPTTVAAGDIFDHNTFLTIDPIFNRMLTAEEKFVSVNISTSDRNNTPPVFGSPSPENKSLNTPLSFIWSIPINDTEGDRFNWTIKCSDGQNSSGVDENNGIKSLNLSNLTYSTIYTIWVNATDYTGSGQSNRQWYIFTTKASLAPMFGMPTPANSSTNQPLSFIWGIPINDPDGDSFSWTIQCSNGQTNSGTGATNGTKTLTLSGLAYETPYKVWVNATDPFGSGQYNKSWYTFSTKTNLPPVFQEPSPVNGSTNLPLDFAWSIPINDSEGDSLTWTIVCSNEQTNNGTGETNGTKILGLFGLSYSTTYKVWVNATDPDGSNQYTRRWYNFTTKTSLPPVFGAPTPENGSIGNQLSFDWSINISDPEGDSFNWVIQCSNGDTASLDGGLNGTKSLSLSNLTYSTTYTVLVNATDPDGSGQYTRRWYMFTTKEDNSPPVFGQPIPANNSIDQPLSLTWSIPINDPEGDAFSWTIQCSNGQTISGTAATNGTKTLSISGLAYLTTFNVWVNATDPTGSDQYTRRWYSFTTKANMPPVFGSPSPINESTNNQLNLTWGILINDSEGNSFRWTIECNNGQNNNGNNAENGTKSLLLSNLSYSTTYTVWVNATDPAGSGQYRREWYRFTTKPNLPPTLGLPNPANRSTYPALSLTWEIPISDSEGDTFNWTIQCSNGQTNGSNNDINGMKSIDLFNLSYKTYRVWVNATDPTGSGLYTRKWYTFTTVSSSGGGGGGGGGTPPAENKKPVADLSVGEPYQGYVNSEIPFDGSRSYDPDGNITEWYWDFGDNSNGIGKIVQHIYSKTGTYNVTLIVTDNKGATDSAITTCIVFQRNRPPTKPMISGTRYGPANTIYTFTAFSTDPDNDTIQYTFDWGDSTSQSSDFVASGTRISMNHSWKTPGKYTLTVTVTDNKTISSSQFTLDIKAGLDNQDSTPGFEGMLFLCAIVIFIILCRKKRVK